MDIIIAIIAISVALVGGLVVGFLLANSRINKTAVQEKENLLKEAEVKNEAVKQEKILQAKEKFFQLKTQHDKQVADKNIELQKKEASLKQKETDTNKKLDEANRKQQEAEKVRAQLTQQSEVMSKKQEELDKAHQKQVQILESISGMRAADAKEQLVESIKGEAKTEAMSYVKDIMDEAKINANKEAKKIVIQALQRVGAEQAVENSVTVFHIEGDEMKGRIIGREGRNIRAFEAATGVEVIVDDTPEAIIFSCFDPIRREIARLAMAQLALDGRIHPARIEEVVEKVKKQIEDEIIETGKRTCIDLGIHALHPELVRHVGKMKYRSSYGQNLLQHSREVANLCAVMATEMGLDAKAAKRAGLLHDIGKAVTAEVEGPHAMIGGEIAKRCGEDPIIVNAIAAHHEEVPFLSIYAPLVVIADTISASRPGARRETLTAYIKRLEKLEEIANTFEGVKKAYALQAGREIRVIVEEDRLDDEKAMILARDIARKIEEEMNFPGQIKVNVIREKRTIEYAR